MTSAKLDETMMILACVVCSPGIAVSVTLARVVDSPVIIPLPNAECTCSSDEDKGILHLKFWLGILTEEFGPSLNPSRVSRSEDSSVDRQTREPNLSMSFESVLLDKLTN
jgi:hypothetical protein